MTIRFPAGSAAERGLALTDADDRRHVLAPEALERESLIFLLFLPDEGLGCIAYTWVDGESRAGSLLLVFSGENDLLFRSYTEGVEMPRDADFDDWTVGDLHLVHGKPHDEAHVSFDAVDGQGRRFALDYAFRASTPAFTYHDNPDGCPAILADNRLEQSGRVRGSITVAGREIPFDTTGHRDHSWGRRDWTAFHQYMWINVQTPSGVGVNLMHGLVVDRVYRLGYVEKDGLQSPIVSIDADLDRDVDQFSYTAADIRLVDAAGRTTTITAQERASVVVWPAGGLESHDASGWCDVDGERGLLHVEEGWDPEFVRRRRASLRVDEGSEESRRLIAVNRGVGVSGG